MEDGGWIVDNGWWLEGFSHPRAALAQAATYAVNGCSEICLILVSRCYID